MTFGFFRRKTQGYQQAPEASAPAGSCLYAIGDVHGCLDQLKEPMDKIQEDAEGREADRRVLIYLGDYVDRGRRCRETIDYVLAGPPDGFEQICLRGNHEEAFEKFMCEPEEQSAWLTFGGAATCNSYGVDIAAASLSDEVSLVEWLNEKLGEAVPSEHKAFLSDLQLSHEEGDYLFVHAGVRPGVPLGEQRAHDLMWIRKDFLLSSADHGKVIVHGHTPENEPVLRTNRIGVDTGACYGGLLTAAVLQANDVSFLQA